jgi:hypothetical protein
METHFRSAAWKRWIGFSVPSLLSTGQASPVAVPVISHLRCTLLPAASYYGWIYDFGIITILTVHVCVLNHEHLYHSCFGHRLWVFTNKAGLTKYHKIANQFRFTDMTIPSNI